MGEHVEKNTTAEGDGISCTVKDDGTVDVEMADEVHAMFEVVAARDGVTVEKLLVDAIERAARAEIEAAQG